MRFISRLPFWRTEIFLRGIFDRCVDSTTTSFILHSRGRWLQVPARVKFRKIDMPSTEIILTENVPGLGAEADVVKVRRGYARNFLLPQGKAYEVTPATLRKLDALKANELYCPPLTRPTRGRWMKRDASMTARSSSRARNDVRRPAETAG